MLSAKPKHLILFLGLSLGVSYTQKLLHADIITDIEELEEKDKDPEKKPTKKKETDKENSSEILAPSSGKKASKTKPVELENPDPEEQTKGLIPEPLDEPVVANPTPAKAPKLKSAKGKSKDQRKKAPVHFQCDGGATYSQNGLTALMEKNVVITQDDLRLQSDEAKLNFNPKEASERVKSAILEGKVSIARYSTDPSERMNAKSDRATFDNVKQIVTLDGNARLWREGDLLKGERIIYDLTTGQVKIDKAQGVMQPERMKK